MFTNFKIIFFCSCFHRLIGFTFGRFDWQHRYSLIKSTILIILFIYSYRLIYRSYQNEYDRQEISKITPNLFGKMIEQINDTLFFILFLSFYIFYMINGKRLIQLFNSSLFEDVYYRSNNNNFHHQFISIVFLIVCNLNSLSIYWACSPQNNNTIMMMKEFQIITISKCLEFYTLIMILMNESLTYLVVVYYKYAIRQTIQKILKQIQSDIIDERECLSRIRLLTTINEKFNQIWSYPMITFVIGETFYLIMTPLSYYLKQISFAQFIVSSLHFIGGFFWIYFDLNIRSLFIELGNVFRSKNHHRQDQIMMTTFRSKTMKKLLNQLNQSMDNDETSMIRIIDQISSLWQRSKITKQIYHYEMIEIYSEYFHLQIYNICIFDWKFFHTIILFAFSYFVLIIQTN